MRFKKDAREGLGIKAGFGHTAPYIRDFYIATIPLGINYLYGKG